MKTKEMIVAVAILVLVPAVAMADWGFSPMMSADGRVDGAMASMSWSFGGGKSQEIILAKNIPNRQSQRAVAKQEAESQQFFSAKEMEKLVSSIQLPSSIEGRKYLKIGAKPVDPKTFDFLKEDAHILLKDAEIKTADNNGKVSVGWLRAGEILVTLKGDTRVIRIWRCGNPILSELYIVAPKTAKVEAAPVVVAAKGLETQKNTDLYPQKTIDRVADSRQSPASSAKWTTGQKWLVGGLAVTAVAAVAYAVIQQNSSHSKTTTTTTTTTTTGGSTGDDPLNGNGPGPNPPS